MHPASEAMKFWRAASKRGVPGAPNSRRNISYRPPSAVSPRPLRELQLGTTYTQRQQACERLFRKLVLMHAGRSHGHRGIFFTQAQWYAPEGRVGPFTGPEPAGLYIAQQAAHTSMMPHS